MADDQKGWTLARFERSAALMIVFALIIGVILGWYARGAGVGKYSAAVVTPGTWNALAAGDPAAGKVAFEELYCFTCHTVAGHPEFPVPSAQAVVPVVLGGKPKALSRAELVDSILAPSHQISEGYRESLVKSGELSRMGDYSRAMTVRQLADLVEFLHSLPSGNPENDYN